MKTGDDGEVDETVGKPGAKESERMVRPDQRPGDCPPCENRDLIDLADDRSFP